MDTTKNAFNLDLSLWGSKVTDLNPTDLPAGASPANGECWFKAGSFSTRPALVTSLDTSLNGYYPPGTDDVQVMSLAEYASPGGDFQTIMLDSRGTIWEDDLSAGVSPPVQSHSTIGTTTAGCRMRASQAFDKLFMAFSNPSLSAGYASSPLVGADVPQYYDGTAMWDVTMDAPAGGLSAVNVPLPSNSLTQTVTTPGPTVFSLVSSGQTDYNAAAPPTSGGTSGSSPVGTVLTFGMPARGTGFQVGSYPASATSGVGTGLSVYVTSIIEEGGGISAAQVGSGGSNYAVGDTGIIGPEDFGATYVVSSVAPGGGTGSGGPGSTTTATGYNVLDIVLGQQIIPQPTTLAVNYDNGNYAEWQDTYYVTANTGDYAFALAGSNPYEYSTQAIRMTAFGGTGFGIPGNATILSVKTTITHGQFSNYQNAAYSSVCFVQGGAQIPATEYDAYPHVPWSQGFGGTETFDAASQMGGLPTIAQLNDPTFGVDFWASITQSYDQSCELRVFYITMEVMYSVPVETLPDLFVGQSVMLTGLTWWVGGQRRTNRSGTWQTPQFSNALTITEVISPTEFYVGYTSSGPMIGDGGTSEFGSFLSLTRTNDIVTGYLVGTTQSQPSQLRPGWFVKVTDTLTTSTVPDGSVPFTANELFQALDGGTGECSIQGDGFGTITIAMTASGTSIANQPVGGWVYLYNSNPSGNYPSGWFQVTAVVSSISFQFYIPSNASSNVENGICYDYWGSLSSLGSPGQGNSGFQLLSVSTQTGTGPNIITWYQLGPDSSCTSSNPLQATPATQVAQGPRQMVVFFMGMNGSVTGVSPPAFFQGKGENYYPGVTVPIGPPGTTARVVGWTPAFGANFYALAPGQVPATAGNPPITTPGTFIYDNYSTTVVMDFSDTALVASPYQLDNAGGANGDMFNYRKLPPALGCEFYQARVGWWGLVNTIPNLLNTGFDGGYTPYYQGTCTVTTTDGGEGTLPTRTLTRVTGPEWAQMGSNLPISLGYPQASLYRVGSNAGDGDNIVITPPLGLAWTNSVFPPEAVNAPYQTTYAVLYPEGALPLGWDASQGDSTGTLDLGLGGRSGFSYRLLGGYNSQIQQSAFQDIWGAPILIPGRSYTARFLVRGDIPYGFLNIDVYSYLWGGVIASSQVDLSTVPSAAPVWQSLPMVGQLVNTMPSPMPQDAVLRIYLSGTPSSPPQGACWIDELEIIDAQQPILYNQVLWSYPLNPFAYDASSGPLGVSTPEFISNLFVLKQYIYILTTDSLWTTQDTGSTPNQWPVAQFAKSCGCAGPWATDTGEAAAWWVGRQGARIFIGAEPKKMSQAVNADFESINWDAAYTSWVCNDNLDRMILFGLPVDGAESPTMVETVSYRLADSAVNVVDPVHVSPYSGKMICTDLGQKWSTWSLPLNHGRILMRHTPNGLARQMVFAGGNGLPAGAGTCFGNLYALDLVNYPPENPAATEWNCVDADYGQIGLPITAPPGAASNSFYQTYFFFAHDVEAMAQQLLESYRKVYKAFTLHVVGVGNLLVTPYGDSMLNSLRPLPPMPLSLIDPGLDIRTPMNHHADRMSFLMQAVPDEGSQAAAVWVTHCVACAVKDKVTPQWGQPPGFYRKTRTVT